MNLWGHQFSQKANQQLFRYLPGGLFESRAEIWEIFVWHFGRTDDLINSLLIELTFTSTENSSSQYMLGSLHPWKKEELFLIQSISTQNRKTIKLRWPQCKAENFKTFSVDFFPLLSFFCLQKLTHGYFNLNELPFL